MTTNRRVLFTLTALAASFAGCAQESAAPPTPAATTARRVDVSTAGSIGGRISFTGQPPAPEFLRVGKDPACVSDAGPNPQSDAVLINAEGGLKNVFVFVNASFDDYAFDTPTEAVTMDQKGCHYAPRVFGVRVGQPIEILNSDATAHNVHALPMNNQEFNESQTRAGMRMTKVFTTPEVMVRFKCDFHGWMAAHVGVMSHPFFAVTGDDGTFELTGLPPGTYTLEAWHETFGTRTQQVVVAPSGRQTVTMAFGAS